MATTYLNRSAVTGNRRTFTISAWVKRSELGTEQQIYSSRSSASNVLGLYFQGSNDTLLVTDYQSGGTMSFTTSAVYRDVSAWYHIVLAVDTTQATDTNRVKLYVNGEQATFSASSYPTLDRDLYINVSGSNHYIGTEQSGRYFNGEMAHVHFIDGLAYQASTFGETDSLTGIWKPITSPSVTYGTNGFFLKFASSGSMGTDSSGNSNNFTVNGNLTQTQDTPSNVFATLNPLYKGESGNDATFSNGNLKIVTNSTSQKNAGLSTFGISSGKYYSEFKLIAEATGESTCGVTYNPELTSQIPLIGSYGYAVASNGTAFYGGSSHGVGAWSNTFTTNDIIGVALDLDNNRVTFSKNGSWTDGSGNWDETSPIAYLTLSSDQTYFIGVSDKSTSQSSTWESNFGNGYFGTTAVASAGTNASGIGIFEYDVPTGYTALSTKGLNL